MAGDAALDRVATFGLEGQPIHPSVRLSPPDWPAFLGAVAHHRLTGLAWAAVEHGTLLLDTDQRSELLERHREAMLCALALERNLLSIASAFEEAEIGLVVLKGPAVAHVCYPDPAWRPFGDVDVLVAVDAFEPACEVLARIGFRRSFVEPRPGFAARFGKGAAHIGPDGLELDLHRLLADGPFGYWVDPTTVFERTSAFDLAGRRLARLDDTAILLHACMHAVLGAGSPILLQLRDVAQIAGRTGVEWPVLAEWGRRWRLRAVLARALDLVEERFGASALPEVALGFRRSLRPSGRERRALDACGRRRTGGRAMASLRAIPGFGSKWAYAGALLFPDREFLAARTGSRGLAGYARRWRVPIRWLAPRTR